MRAFASFNSDSGTTGSPAPRPDIEPSSISLRQRKTRLGERFRCRATSETLLPGLYVSSTIARFSWDIMCRGT
jgi:hypothetical protein